MTIDNNQLSNLTNTLNNLVIDLDKYINKNRQLQKQNRQNQSKEKNNSKCHYIKSKDGKDRIMCVHVEPPENNPIHRNLKKREKSRLADKPIHKKMINGEVMAPWGDKWLPVCDGSGFPYVQGCYSDASNWSGSPNQCIIENPATPNLANGSLYTCGFLW